MPRHQFEPPNSHSGDKRTLQVRPMIDQKRVDLGSTYASGQEHRTPVTILQPRHFGKKKEYKISPYLRSSSTCHRTAAEAQLLRYDDWRVEFHRRRRKSSSRQINTNHEGNVNVNRCSKFGCLSSGFFEVRCAKRSKITRTATSN